MKLRHVWARAPSSKTIVILLSIILLSGAVPSIFFKVQAAQLADRSLLLTSAAAGAINVNYTFSFTLATAGALGSIVLELCTNDPFPQTPCTAPIGLDMTGASIASQTGEVGFAIDASSTANMIVLTRAPAAAATVPVSYSFNGIINPSAAATYYGRLITFATNDASGPLTDKAGIAWATTNQFSLNTEVPQFLEFCSAITISAFDCNTAVGNAADFGNLSPAASAAVNSQFVSASNAGFGYTIAVYGLTMTSGINVIPSLAVQTFAAPGNNQFGLNARANTLPAVGTDPVGPGVAFVDPNYDTPDQYRFVNGDTVVTSLGSTDYRKFTITYITNVSSVQPPGNYSSTLTYVCLANF